MATDDLLWKKVDELKAKRPKPKRKTMSRRRSASKPPQKPKSAPASPTNIDTTGSETMLPERKIVTDHAYGRTDARTASSDDRLFGQVPPRPVNRRPERYAFNFWADQITRLKKLKQVLNVAKDADDRSEITLSDLVREAIDDYLDRQTGRIDRPDSTA